MNRYSNGALVIFLTLGFLFLRSGWSKLSGGKFVGTLSETLRMFASKNPHTWYKDFLNSTAIPNSITLGNLIMWGEFLSGAAMVVGSIYLLLHKGKGKMAQIILILGLIGGAFLNLNFYFAAGWSSPSTEGINLLMLVIEVVGVFILAKSSRE